MICNYISIIVYTYITLHITFHFSILIWIWLLYISFHFIRPPLPYHNMVSPYLPMSSILISVFIPSWFPFSFNLDFRFHSILISVFIPPWFPFSFHLVFHLEFRSFETDENQIPTLKICREKWISLEIISAWNQFKYLQGLQGRNILESILAFFNDNLFPKDFSSKFLPCKPCKCFC